MNDKCLCQLVAALLLLVIASVGGGILFIYLQFPSLENYKDIRFVSESLQTDYALSICLATITHKQTLHTTQSDGTIWQRTSEQWEKGESRIFGHGGEAHYQREILPFVTIGSRLFFHSNRPHNVIFVNNRLSIQLPGWLCHPSL